MKKSDLKTGMRVETRDGEIYLVLKKVKTSCYGLQKIYLANEKREIMGSWYHENLLSKSSYNDDIVAVYRMSVYTDCVVSGILNLNKKHLIWKREVPSHKEVVELLEDMFERDKETPEREERQFAIDINALGRAIEILKSIDTTD